MIDDWFAEPKIEEGLNDLYTRRLIAWGWLRKNGRTAWDYKPGLMDCLSEYYLPGVLAMLNEDFSRLRYGDRDLWKRNPEAPA